MLLKEKQEIVKLFKNNMKGYLSVDNIQEAISNVSYMYWKSKFDTCNGKKDIYTKEDLKDAFGDNPEMNKSTVLATIDYIKRNFSDDDLKNIFKYLNSLTEQQLVEIICEDYNDYSRFKISTPITMNELVYKILEQHNTGKNVLDICSYEGGFLVDYAKKNKEYTYNGIEINCLSNDIANQKLEALGAKGNCQNINIFDYQFHNKFDKVFSNFPFAIRLSEEDYKQVNSYDNVVKFEFAKKISSDWMFVNCVINSLSENGKAIVVMRNSTLNNYNDLDYRKALVDLGYIETVISLPDRLFTNMGIPVTLIVLSKGNSSVKFIEARNMISSSKTSKMCNDLDVEKIFAEYLNEYNSEVSINKSIEEISTNDYCLLSNRYINLDKVVLKNPKNLKDICTNIFRGYQLSKNEIEQYSTKTENSKEYRFINIVNIKDNDICGDFNTIYSSNTKYDKYLLKKNDLLITIKGPTTKIAVFDKEDANYVPSGNFAVIRLNTDIVNPYYLKMFFESKKGHLLLDITKTGTVLLSINISLLESIEVPVPSISKQNEAVNKYLAKVDEIQIVRNRLKKLEESLCNVLEEEF